MDIDINRRDLVGIGRAELAAALAEFGAEPFRARQLWHWIYHRGVTDFAVMTNLAKGFREQLAERFALGRPGVATAQVSRSAPAPAPRPPDWPCPTH